MIGRPPRAGCRWRGRPPYRGNGGVESCRGHLGRSYVPEGPDPARVPVRGVPGRLAAVMVVGALGVIVAVGLTGRRGEPPRDSPAELRVATAVPTATPTRVRTPTTADTALPLRPCTVVAPTAGTPLPDVAGAQPGDDSGAPLRLGAVVTKATLELVIDQAPEKPPRGIDADRQDPPPGLGDQAHGLREGGLAAHPAVTLLSGSPPRERAPDPQAPHKGLGAQRGRYRPAGAPPEFRIPAEIAADHLTSSPGLHEVADGYACNHRM